MMNSIGKIAAFISLLCFVAIGIAMFFILQSYGRAAHLSPSPFPEESHDKDGFPFVDWDYWLEINQDIVGWVTIPGTNIDYPIVQAPENDPQFYLTHDVYRSWNYMGCPYLDADCKDKGLLESRNALVFAHNLGYGDEFLFAHVARYSEAEYAESHRIILLQTPQTKVKYLAQGSSRIQGSDRTKRTRFEDKSDFDQWLYQRLQECSVLFNSPNLETSTILTLCTCSYSYWTDERTLLYATPEAFSS